MTEAVDFDPAGHVYSRAGRVVPGVTTIIGATIDAGVEWPPEAGRRGTIVHLATQFDDEGTLNLESLAPQFHGYLEGWRAFRRALNPKIVALERRVFHPVLEYAGTLDRLLEIGPRLALVDIKSGQKRPGVRAQLGGYALALEQEGIVPDDYLAVYVSKDGRFDVLEVPKPKARGEWLAAFTVYQLQKES